MKSTTTGAKSGYLNTEIVALVRDGAPSIVGSNSGVSSLITNDVKNITNRELIINKKICAQNPSK
jgi:hypothetical protein